MSQVLVAKGLGGATILGGAGAGGYIVYESYFGKTIEEVLTEKGLTILKQDNNDDEWGKIATAYKNSGESDANKANGFIGDAIAEGQESTSKDKFKKPCEEVLSEKFKDDKSENFKNASRWCVKEEAISTILERIKQQMLSDDGDTSEWGAAVKKQRIMERKKVQVTTMKPL